MSSSAKIEHTPGPYFWREFAQEAEDLEQMRKLGMTPTRLLTNEGQVALMAGSGHDVKRIALIDCQTNYKRGQGYKTACAERDANAAMFAAMPDLVKALEYALGELEYVFTKHGYVTTETAIARARTALSYPVGREELKVG